MIRRTRFAAVRDAAIAVSFVLVIGLVLTAVEVVFRWLPHLIFFGGLK